MDYNVGSRVRSKSKPRLRGEMDRLFAALSHFLISLLRRASLYVEPAEESTA